MNIPLKTLVCCNSAKPPQALALAISDDRSHASISIRGTIGDWWEGRDIEQVERELDWLPETVKNLTIRITTMGGKLDHGLAIHNALQRHPAHKVAIIEGVAASAGTLVAMAADEIHIHANATMMTHGVSFADDEGNPLDIPDAERAMNETILETYAAKTGKSREALAKYVAKDNWMTAREAVAAGFADQLIELATPRAQAESVAAFACAMGVPAEVIARAQAEAEPSGDKDPATSEGGDPQPVPQVTASGTDVVPQASATFAAQINALAVANGLGAHVGAWLLDGSLGTIAQAEAAIREACEIRDLCAYADASDRIGEFIRTRKTLAEARAELINARADAADDKPTNSTRHNNGAPKPAASGQAVWAKVFPTRTQ